MNWNVFSGLRDLQYFHGQVAATDDMVARFTLELKQEMASQLGYKMGNAIAGQTFTPHVEHDKKNMIHIYSLDVYIVTKDQLERLISEAYRAGQEGK